MGTLLMASVSTFAVGCADTGGEGGGGTEFVSANPDPYAGGDDATLDGGGDGEGNVSSSTSAGSGGGSEGNPGVAPEDPARLIAEADIVQMQGDRLFALSAFSGLAIIDLSDRDAPVILGQKALGGEPFEMYVDGNVVYAMFNGWGHYEDVDGGMAWVTSSHVEALDVADPSAIESLASFDMPGSVSDSRMVGEVLYTVTFQDGWCWDCEPDANTTVTSFFVGDPKSPQLVDQIELPDAGYEYGWRRSISVTTDRLYVGGVEWGGENDSSTIDVVDISNPSGELVLGASVTVAGQILSRWQMDEYEGVLRVVSQPWSSSVYPKVQTFQIQSSSSIVPLGETEIVTPVPESLRATRFDGDRAYAITAEQIDPLFTIDLSDPAQPKVVGQLEIPGWVYHIEPRGDRLLALGFDGQNADGGLNVSLFDVADPTAPSLIRRVAFGGDWGGFGEDQDRVHKAFKILPDLGLLLVPYSAYTWNDYGCGGYESGIQLIDWQNDDLTRRGVAPIRGEARRAFIHDERLFALSDEQLRGFDFSDRDAPTKRSEVSLATHVSQVEADGDILVRLAADWWTSEPRLEVVLASDPSATTPIGAIDLGAMLADVEQDESCYGWGYWGVRLFAHGDAVYLVWPSWYDGKARVAAVDLSDPTKPRVGGHVDLPFAFYGYSGWYNTLIASGDTVAQLGSTLAFQELVYTDTYETDYGYYTTELDGARIHFVSLANVDAPMVASSVALPKGAGYSGILAEGKHVYTSHWEAVTEDESLVKFYLDRVDLESPILPILPIVRTPINVPGSLVSYEPSTGRAVTVDYRRESLPMLGWEACYATYGYEARFDQTHEGDPDVYGDELGICTVLHRSLALVQVDEGSATATLLDSEKMPMGYIGSLLVGEDRVFYSSNLSGYDEATGEYWSEETLHAVGGIADGEFVSRAIPLSDTWWAWPAAAEGQTVVALTWPGAIVTVDTSDLESPVVRKLGDMPWWIQSVELEEGKLFMSLGPYGLTVVDVE